MKIKNRQQFLAILAIAGIALLAADKLVISPLQASWKARSERITELNKNITQASVLLDREQIIRQRWKWMQTNTLSNNMSSAESEVFNAFYRWAQDSRISISSIKPQWKRNDDYMTYECRTDAFGNMGAVTRFLYEVEKDPMALRVEAIEITSRDNNGQQLSLGLQLSGLMINPPPEGAP